MTAVSDVPVPSQVGGAGPQIVVTPDSEPVPAARAARRVVPMQEQLARWRSLRAEAVAGPAAATERMHAQGRLTARERLDVLLDPGSFVEIDLFRRRQTDGFELTDGRPATDGVVTGSGTVDGRRVFVYAQDFRILGGSLGEAHAAKVHKVMDLAIATGSPLISLVDGGGARIHEGVGALAGFGGIFRRNVAASGVIPQISVVLGPCAGGAAYSPALTDFVFMVRETAHMFITGPDVVRAVTGESVSAEHLGGAKMHGSVSGVASFVYDDERSCLDGVRRLLAYLPDNSTGRPAAVPAGDPADRSCERLLDLVPADPSKPYDMRKVLTEVVDGGDLVEVHKGWARNVLCALARLDGEVVGIVASQPLARAGALDIHASEKAARFVSMCDAFNIPLVTVVDVPGFLPGVAQEHNGIIRHGAKLLYAYCAATVPRVQLILRKAYGGAYIVMDSRSIGADVSLAWPTNEIAVMGAQGAVDVICRKEIAAADDPEERRAELVGDYTDRMMHPYYAAERGLVDDVIDPADTRTALIRALAMLRDKQVSTPRRKHGNIPM